MTYLCALQKVENFVYYENISPPDRVFIKIYYMDKVVKKWKVAVIISPGFGSWFYTWNTEHPEMIFHPEIVKKIQEKERITEEFMASIWFPDVYIGSNVNELRIVWLKEWTKFKIDEYDGSESILTGEDLKLTA